jgi:hypothetical protein
MPKWHFRLFHLWVVHLGNRYILQPVRVFKDFAVQMAPKLFQDFPLEKTSGSTYCACRGPLRFR